MGFQALLFFCPLDVMRCNELWGCAGQQACSLKDSFLMSALV